MNNKLCLGTVQFGLNYGVNNFVGKPLEENVFSMLDEAIDNGITIFDTAVAYGNAETLLGEYGISKKNVKVISKLKPNLVDEKCSSPEKIIEEQIVQSLERMGLNSLDGYLLHTPENFYNSRVINGLKQCKEKGLIKHFGVSIYETQHALDVVKSGQVDYIQIPYSVFDQRLDRTNFFEISKQNGVTVFGRSAFLQGLILMEEEKIPSHLAMAANYLKKLDKIIAKYGFTRLQAAFLFSYTHPGIDFFVFGVDNLAQLKDDIELSRKSYDFTACREEIGRNLLEIDKSIIFPSLWAKKANS